MTSTTTPRTARESDRFPWPTILLLAAGTLWTVTAELVPAGLLLQISDDTEVAPGTVGYLVTTWGLTIAALSLPLTRVTRHLDRRTLLAASLAFTGGATLLTAVAPTFPLLVAARTLAAAGHGLFWALVVVTAASLVTEQQAGRAVAVVVAGPTVATVATVPGATALGEATSWRLSFGIIGILTVATGVLLVLALPRIPAPATNQQGSRDPSIPAVLRVAALGALLLVAHFVAFTLIAAILTGPGGLGRSQVSVALLVFGLTGAIGLTVAPAVVNRLEHWSLPIIGALLAAGLVAVPAAGHHPWAVMSAVAWWGFVVGALPVVFQTRLLALASPAFRPTAGAVIVVAFNLGVAAGAALGGTLHGHVGAEPLPLIAAGLALIASVALSFRPKPTSPDGGGER